MQNDNSAPAAVGREPHPDQGQQPRDELMERARLQRQVAATCGCGEAAQVISDLMQELMRLRSSSVPAAQIEHSADCGVSRMAATKAALTSIDIPLEGKCTCGASVPAATPEKALEHQRLLIAMAKDWTDVAVVRDAPERVPHVIEQLIAEIERLAALPAAAEGQ